MYALLQFCVFVEVLCACERVRERERDRMIGRGGRSRWRGRGRGGSFERGQQHKHRDPHARLHTNAHTHARTVRDRTENRCSGIGVRGVREWDSSICVLRMKCWGSRKRNLLLIREFHPPQSRISDVISQLGHKYRRSSYASLVGTSCGSLSRVSVQ